MPARCRRYPKRAFLMIKPFFCLWVLAASSLFAADAKTPKTPKQPDDLKPQLADGYRGIWYMNQRLPSDYVYKYSGGFATYPQQHVPIAIHVASQKKTFFVFGGSAGNVS